MQLIDSSNAQWHWALRYSLMAFIGFLPLFEAPKNIFLILFLLLGFWAIIQSRNSWRWLKSDSLVALWTVSGFIVAAFAKIHAKEWDGAVSMMWLGLLLLVIKKLPVNDREQQGFDHMVLLSTVVTTFYGLWRLWVTQQDKLLELNSVGHVNHSAIYLALSFSLAFALLITHSVMAKRWLKIWLWVCVLIIGFAILVANSRATVIVMAVIAFSFALFWIKRSKVVLLAVALSFTTIGAGMLVTKAPIVQKQIAESAADPNLLGPRQAIWNSSLLIWRHAPIFGVGLKNYGKVDWAMQKQWLEQDGIQYVDGDYRAFAHSHNLYLSLLAEQGLFGLLTTLSLLLCIAYSLYRHYPQPHDSDTDWCRWLAAVGALEVIIVNGLFNTTLHHEHGLLSVLLIGWWWARLPRPSVA